MNLKGRADWVRTELWDVMAKGAGVAGELRPDVYQSMLLKLAEQQIRVQPQKREGKLKE